MRLAIWVLMIPFVASAQTFDPKPWPTEGSWNSYTVKSTPINDRKASDQSNGGTSPQNIANISSGTPDQSLPSVYFAYSGTSNTLFIRFRLESNPNAYNFGNVATSDPWNSGQWSMFIDVDGDGWRDFVVFLDGSSGSASTPIDRIRLIYSRLKTTQSIDFTQPGIYLLGEIAGAKAEGNRLRRYDGSGVNYTTDWSSNRNVLDFGTSRITDLTATNGDYLLDFQIPVSMLDARPYNGPQLTVSSIQSISFATANSLNDPFQKDFAYPGAFCASATSPMPGGDPITFDNASLPKVIVTSVTATFCPNFTLTTRILTAQQVPNCNTVVSSAVDVKFFYYWDQNANGLADDGGSDWVLIGTGTATTLGEWSTTWNSSALPRGQYLIKVRGTDTQNFTQDSYTQSTTQYGSTIAVVQNNCGIIPATMAKSVTPSLVQSNAPDRTVTYTITVSNPQASAVTLSQIVDTLPSGFTYTGNAAGGTLTPTTSPSNPSSGTLTWTFPSTSIPAGGTATLRFTATTTMSAGTYTNTATATGSTFFAPIVGAAPVTVTSAAATLTKTVSTNVGLNPGQKIAYTLTYQNTGSVPLTNVTVRDSLVQGLSHVWASSPGSYDAATRTVTWSIGSVAAGSSASVVETVQVSSPYNGTNPLVNSGRLTASELTTSVTSNSTSNNVLGPVLALSKSASPQNVIPGNTVTFTILYGNSGTGIATNVTVLDTLPANMTYVASSATPITPTVTTVGGRQVLSFGAGSIAAGGGNLNNSITFQALVANPYPTVGVNQLQRNVVAITSTEITTPLVADAPVYVTAIPTVGITKTSDKSVYASQDSATFTITLTNNGYFAATLDTLEDVLPNTFSYRWTNGGTLSPTTFPTAGATGTVRWRFSPAVSIAPGVTRTLTFRAGVAIAGGSYTNTAIARGIVNSAAQGSVSATLPITVAEGEEAINKAVNRTTAFVGDTLLYTISYLNGTSGTVSRTIRDTIHATLTYVTGSQTVSTPGSFVGITGRVLSWNTGSVAAGGSITITFRAVATTGSTTVGNYAWVNTTIPTLTNTVATVIQSPPSLTFTKTVDVTTAPVGTQLNYTITYFNAPGVAPSTNTILSDTIPSALTYVTSSATGGGAFLATPAPKGRIQWNLGTVAPNTGGSVTFSATIDNGTGIGTVVTNWARLTNSEGQNRSASAATTVSAVPNFTITKSVDKVSAGPGDQLTYTISYQNTGTATATTVVLRDTIPANTSFVSASNGGSDSAGVVRWTLGSVAAGASGSVTLVVQIASPLTSGSVAQIANRASVTSANAVTRTSATVLTNVLYPQIVAVKSVDSASARSLSRITYTITLSNSTIIPGTNTVVTDAIPANTQYVASSTQVNGVGVADVASTSPLVSGLNVGTVTTGSPVAVTFQVTIAAPIADGTSITNRARFTTAKLTGTDSSNIVTTTAISFPNMILSKNVNRSAAQPGDTVTYTVTYSNNGTASAGFVIITDGIPTNTTYVANSVILNGTSRTDAADADGVTVSGGMVTATIGTVASGGSGTLTFKVRVN